MWLHLQYLPPVFCEAIGILKPCTVTLKTSTSSTRSWQARVTPYEGSSHHVSGLGWTQFCRENRIKVGDVCTIKISKTTLWHVIINSPEWWMGSVASMGWVRCSYHGSSSVTCHTLSKFLAWTLQCPCIIWDDLFNRIELAELDRMVTERNNAW